LFYTDVKICGFSGNPCKKSIALMEADMGYDNWQNDDDVSKAPDALRFSPPDTDGPPIGVAFIGFLLLIAAILAGLIR
jgi:hypothetical protein